MAATVEHGDVGGHSAQREVKLGARDGRGSSSGNDNFNFLDFLVHNFQRVQQGRAADDGRAVLVVVHDRDFQIAL